MSFIKKYDNRVWSASAANTKLYIQVHRWGWWIGSGWYRAARIEIIPRKGVWFRMRAPMICNRTVNQDDTDTPSGGE